MGGLVADMDTAQLPAATVASPIVVCMCVCWSCPFSVQDPRFNLRRLYLPAMADAQKVLHVFGELCRQHLKGRGLWAHVERVGVSHAMFATEWLLTMFCRGFSFDLVTRVWDAFLLEGYKIVYRVALALVKSMETQLLEADFEASMALFRNLPKIVDADKVMDMAFALPLKRAHIAAAERQYDETLKNK